MVRPSASQSAYSVPFPPPVSPLSPDPVAVGDEVLLPVPESPVGAAISDALSPADAEPEGTADDVLPPADAEPEGTAVGGAAAWSSPWQAVVVSRAATTAAPRATLRRPLRGEPSLTVFEFMPFSLPP
ncbi:hypothetical protein [Streptomyces sp. WAC01280]|uniref:hypothetical protein n=1 Tax=Streptomyces sp. WAC01280 TaxID=2487424 RepID=UPI00163D2B81|nr:hypothetical protein [Streptomyces sp. WAC01280]